VKEQILQLDAHDDFISARDKMGWTQTARVLLVWPPHGRVLTRKLDLVLLHRHANRLGAHLALITSDPIVRDHARALRLPVFSSLEASRNTVWRSRSLRPRYERRQNRPDTEAIRRRAVRSSRTVLPDWVMWTIRGLVFAAGMVGLTGLIAALGPSATITVTPAAVPVETRVEITADPSVMEIDGALIPARIVRVEVEADGSTPTTGLRAVPSAPAAGTVLFTSLDGVATIIPQGTGIRTTAGVPVRFRTTRTIRIDAAIGATASVEIAAVDSGPAGNVGAGLINAIDGPLGLQLAVTNVEPTAGGASTERPSVTTADRARLRTELMARLSNEALAAIESQLNPGEFLAYDSVRVAETVASTYDLAVGEHADSVRLTLRIAATGLAISENDARKVAAAALQAAVSEGYTLIPGRERFERHAEVVVADDRRIHFGIMARSMSVAVIDQRRIREVASGQPTPQTRLQLARELPLADLPDIAIEPAWYPRLPWIPFRIHVVVRAGA
jgi:hypothetical protein